MKVAIELLTTSETRIALVLAVFTGLAVLVIGERVPASAQHDNQWQRAIPLQQPAIQASGQHMTTPQKWVF